MNMIEYILFSFLFLFIISRLTCGWSHSKGCFVGKTALITGANSGIGYEAALTLASRGCRVIIADVVDATAAKNKIIRETNNPNVVTKHLDLGSLDSVRRLAEEIITTEKKLDLLINNAGIGSTALQYTEDGLQTTMQVNYFGHFLLTHLLADLLKKSTPSRIIFTSSIVAFISLLDVENINSPETYHLSGFTYGNSKLCLAVAAKCFGEKLRGTGVTAYSFHPGAVRTRIFWKALQNKASPWQVFTASLGFIALTLGKSPEEGAQTMLHLATDKGVEKHTGGHFWDCSRFFFPPRAYNAKFCENVWKKSKELVNLKPNECVI
ncbi:hypothetical protein JTB14_022755 [Gonioctena quinquepunctata]|nr:hypothetical protein JTB14_022755 [Gonioctena quinquepunctata]